MLKIMGKKIFYNFTLKIFAYLPMCDSYLTVWRPETPKRVTLSNSEDPGEMPHNAAFHQGLHCLLRQNQYSAKEI